MYVIKYLRLDVVTKLFQQLKFGFGAFIENSSHIVWALQYSRDIVKRFFNKSDLILIS